MTKKQLEKLSKEKLINLVLKMEKREKGLLILCEKALSLNDESIKINSNLTEVIDKLTS